jgi:hypothetical protein
MAARGFTAALAPSGLGGVLVQGKIERLALVSLTDIARLWCHNNDDKTQTALTNAARRYIFALAVLAEGHPRGTGSHRLRSGCELVTKDPQKVELRGGADGYPDAAELLGLFIDRKALISIAAEAMGRLEIPGKLDDFEVKKEMLQADFGNATPGAADARTGGTRGKSRGK